MPAGVRTLAAKSRLVWTRSALDDLESIRLYLGENADEETMRTEGLRIWESVSRLRDFPDSGRPGRVPMTRELVAPPYVIPYRCREEAIEILAVFHSRQRRKE